MAELRQERGRAASDAGADESLAGVVDRIFFHNGETGFAVLGVRASGQRELATVVGLLPEVRVGESVAASGRWETSAKHGRQFRAERLTVTPPTTAAGIRRYLGSGLIPGVGPELARRLVQAFGDQVFEVIEHQPERLETVEGIGPVRLGKILQSFEEQREVRDIMLFLQSHGVGSARAMRIYRTYGAEAITLVSEDPYRLARDIRGIGFDTADRIAERLGVDRQAPIRARAGLSYTLQQAVDAGHCALPESELLERAEELLEIPRVILEQALRHEVTEGRLILDRLERGSTAFLAPLWYAERATARALRRLVAGEPPWGVIDADAALPWVERRLGVELSPSQRRAIELALRSKAAVITGGPGVGKTTLVNAILQIVRAKGLDVALAAPTGRAAKRLAESTGLEAKTIHRLLEFEPQTGGFRRGPDKPLRCDLLVVDEMSMVDVPLMASLSVALDPESALLLVGDVDQLPSVGPGQVLRDVIESGLAPVARLTEIFRQATSSRIVTTAHRINQGVVPELATDDRDPLDSDFFFVPAADAEDASRKVIEIAARRIPRRFGLDPMREIQVLCPMNRGGAGARSLNEALQAVLNPPSPERAEIERFGWTFRAGDKVMQTQNDYDKDVFNGDVGVIESIERKAEEVVVRFDDRSVVYRFGELDQMALAYAMSIHKSQGSEYPAVVIPLLLQHYMMLQRNLVYTGVTRGKRLVVLVGQQRALATAIRAGAPVRRCSKLRAWLAEEDPEAS